MIPSSLNKEEIERYSRQILLPEIGPHGQERLRDASILIVGTGGLGSPSSLYLVAAGIGRIGLIDYDTVDLSNIHRQVVHQEGCVGLSKVESAKLSLQQINSGCQIDTYNTLLTRENAEQIVGGYDVIVDASDNAVTRYLVNDVCILLGKPLVSGAALRFDGQLTTYGFNGSPCYRCIYPTPPDAQLVVNCDVGGVLGPVTGVIGSFQALEVIKIIAMKQSSYAGKLLLFNGLEGSFRTIKLRPRHVECLACGDNSVIKSGLVDYEVFCNAKANDKTANITLLPDSERISCEEFAPLYRDKSVKILDVRPSVQYDICRFEGSLNIPIDELPKRIDNARNLGKDIVVVCRRGNDSQLAVDFLRKRDIKCIDLIGGILAYADRIDPTLPKY